MRASQNHFTSNDVSEWLQKFKICSKADKQTDETKALKLSTLLEKEAFAVWLEIPETEQECYEFSQEKLSEKLAPMTISHKEFHQRKHCHGLPLSVFVHGSNPENS